MIFTKTDKIILITSAIILVIILSIVFLVYKYTPGSLIKVNNLTGGAQTEQKSINKK